MSNAAIKLPENPAGESKKIHCPKCDHVIYDGEVIRSRCVKVHTAEALCRCKAWVDIKGAFTFP